MNTQTKAQRINKRQDAIWERYSRTNGLKHPRKLVRISIHGGVAEIQDIPEDIDVEIIDYDNQDGKAEINTYEGPM